MRAPRVFTRRVAGKTDVVNARYVAMALGFDSPRHLMTCLAARLGCGVDADNHCMLDAEFDVQTLEPLIFSF